MKQEQEKKLEIAEERLSTAKLLADNGKNVDAVSRIYYAMFHAAKALLLEKESDPKTHSGTSSELGKLYRDELGKHMTREFSRIQEKRERADYGEIEDIEKEELQKDLETAEEFISKTRKILN